MNIDLDICKTIAVKQGLPLQFVIKEFYLFDVLGQVAQNSKNLVFKGGTALNKIYLGGMQRFSEDLDFDLDSHNFVSECEKLKESIMGYDTGKIRKIKDTIQFYCIYESPLGKDNIRIDIAKKQIITANPVLPKQVVSDYTNASVTGIKAYSIEDLAARKIHALATRTEGKDVYDVFNALPLCENMEKPLKHMLKSENEKENVKEFLESAINKLKRIDSRQLRNITNPFIPADKRPSSWGELKNDLIMKLEQLT